MTSQATGFVVDAERGIILSNRHVVQPGPILAEATFTQSKEEVKLIPIYRDPVHDFGFFKFEKNAVKYTKIVSIDLRPENVRVGLDIRVVGNDSGERLSILGGTLARLDRQAPFYGNGKYNDWNTFYYQAASMTSGGSSGSPVIDINGNAIALNAGGAKTSASSFFLPLDRVVRALRIIQEDKYISRGTIQTILVYTTYDELRRLGLQDQDEEEIRTLFPKNTGMLTINHVNQMGPAWNLLEPGDILLKINNQWIDRFILFEEILDSSVGETIHVVIQRGAKRIEVGIQIQDLHSITPNSFIEIGGGILHELSYQMAVGYMVPTGSVFVASAGYMLGLAGITRRCVIESVNNEPTPDMESFIAAISKLRDNDRVPVTHYALTDINKSRVSIIHMDVKWHKLRKATRNDVTGLWDYTELPTCDGEAIIKPHTAPPMNISDSLGPAKYIVPSFVNVEFHLPFKIDGVIHQVHSGLGIILDHERGLLVTDRNAVPAIIGDVILTFFNSIIIPGKVLFLHQTYNIAIVQYDPSLLGDTKVANAKLSTKKIEQNDSVYLVCISKSYQPIVRKTVVTNIRQFFVSEPIPPSYRSMNVEGIELENPVSNGGVIVTEDGEIQALYPAFTKHNSKQRSEFYIGLYISILTPIIKYLNDFSQMYSLEAELSYTQVAHARALGLSDDWASKMDSTNSVVVIRRLTSSAQSFDLLKTGDLILAVNKCPVSSFEGVMKHIYESALDLTILRKGKVIELNVPLTPMVSTSTERLVGWAGAIFQMPHKPVFQQLISVPTGHKRVLCSVVYDGSPAQLYGLTPLTWVTEINDIPVKDLDDFLETVSAIPSDSFVRLKLVSYNRFIKVITLRTNAHYFGSWQIRRDDKSASDKCTLYMSVLFNFRLFLSVLPLAIEDLSDVSRNQMVVAVRVRPLSTKEKLNQIASISKVVNEKTVMVYDITPDFLENILRKERQREKLFAFDWAFGEESTQEQIFSKLEFLVDAVIDGFNGTVFAYGATGAGKTYTMIGTGDSPGIMPLTLESLFKKINRQIAKYEISISYLEIYNENIRDLISGKPEYLEIREDTSKGIVVAGITYVSVSNSQDILHLLAKGNKNRTCEATGANQVSSRSHAIVQVFLGKKVTEKGVVTHQFSKLSMIDLAGSERAADTLNRGQRMIEGANINRSLLALGNCINSLIDPSKKSKFINYRDSKLTRLLKDSLGGNCKTVMIANISPAATNFDDTLNTLKYASRAATIKLSAAQQAPIRDEEYQAALEQFKQEAHTIKMNPAIILHSMQQKKEIRKELPIPVKPRTIPSPFVAESQLDTTFFSLKKDLEELFSEQLSVKMELTSLEEPIQTSQKITHLSKQDQQKKMQLEQKMSNLDLKIKNIQHNLPKNSELMKDYIHALVKAHYLEIENIDLDLKYSQAHTQFQSQENELHSQSDLLQMCRRIIKEQKILLVDNHVKLPKNIKNDLEQLDKLLGNTKQNMEKQASKDINETAEEASNQLLPPLEKSFTKKSLEINTQNHQRNPSQESSRQDKTRK